MPLMQLSVLLTCLVSFGRALTNQRCLLKSRPSGAFRASDLTLSIEEEDPEALADGEVLVAVDTLSIEAFYRTTLDEVVPFELDP